MSFAGLCRCFLLLALASTAGAQEAASMIQTLLQHEEAGQHRGHYTYSSEERSERTGGHLWNERVAETNWGKVRFLTAEDGNPLGTDRLAAERGRIEAEAADPEAFRRSEAARADDEQHAKQMLALLPKAFLFDTPQAEGDSVRIAYHPNPAYAPQGMEERVLHGMSGSVLIDAQTIRLHGIDGRMAQDLSIGFGLASIHAGSNFSTLRKHVGGADWKTETVHTDIKGRALFLKTLARSQNAKHSAFKKIPDEMTVREAVTLLEQ